jgi:hypothetical protein
MLSFRRAALIGILLTLVFTGFRGLLRDQERLPNGAHTSPTPNSPSTAQVRSIPALPFEPVEDRSSSLEEALEKARLSLIPVEGEAAGLPENSNARWFAYNPGQDLAARFRDDSVQIASETGQVSISRRSASPVVPSPAGDSRIEYHHADGVVEWWTNRREGFEQGFTVPRRASNGPMVRIPMKVEGMAVESDPDRPGDLFFTDGLGAPQLGYRDLKAWDADGKPLAANMLPTPDGLEISVATSGAVFPIQIDPIVVRLQASFAPMALGPIGPREEIGQSLAISGDLAVVGVPYDDDDSGYVGAIYVFGWRESAWHFEARLRAPKTPTEDLATMGFKVSISGNEIHASARGRPSNTPIDPSFIQTFSKVRGKWKAGSKLRSPDANADYEFAGDFAMSGNALVVAGSGNNGGRLWCYQRKDKGWLLQQVIDTPGVIHRVAMEGAVMATHGDGVAIYQFDGTSWERSPANIPGEPFLFISNIAVSGNRVAFGAQLPDPVTGWRGTAFLCQPTGSGWQATEFGSSFASWVEFGEDEVFTQNGDSIQTFRLDPDPVAGPVIVAPGGYYRFGSPFAVSGNRLIAAGILENGGGHLGGGVHAFERTAAGAWQNRGPLNPGYNGQESLHTGGVATTGGKSFFGAPGDANPGGFRSGSVYVMSRTKKGWTFEARVVSPRPRAEARFGRSLASVPGHLVVGTSERTTEADPTTIAHVFRGAGGTWLHEAALESPFPGIIGTYETFMTTRNDRILIGLPNQSANGRTGCAILYSKFGPSWQLEHAFTGNPQVTGHNLGQSVAMNRDTVWIATAPVPQGRVHGYQKEGSTWTLKTSLTPPSASRSNPQRSRIALSGDQLWVTSAGVIPTSGGIDIYDVDGTNASLGGGLTAGSADVFNFGRGVAVSGDIATVLSETGEPRVPHLDWFQRSNNGWALAGGLDLSGSISEFSASAFHGDTLLVLEPEALTQPFPGETVMQGLARQFRISGPMPDVALFSNRRKVAGGKSLKVPASGQGLVIDIANSGEARLVDIATSLEGDDAGAFLLTPLPQELLRPGERMSLTVTLSPGAVGRKSARLVITSNDPDGNPSIIHLMHVPER